MMMKTRKVTRLQVRDLASFSGFEKVQKMIKQERLFRKTSRQYKTIVETLGEEYLKKRELNKSAYVCINEEYGIDGYIEGLSELPSPPPSGKPSAVKLSKAYTFTDLGKRSCKQKPSSNQGLVDPLSIQVKPLTASKKQVSFMTPLDGADVARLNHCREF